MTKEEKIALAVDRIDAWRHGDAWRYYAAETSETYEVTVDELVELAELMSDDDPQIAGDAYSHWCAGGAGRVVGALVDRLPRTASAACGDRDPLTGHKRKGMMMEITHRGNDQIVSRATLRSVLRASGESCYCAPDDEIEWDAGPCPEHGDTEGSDDADDDRRETMTKREMPTVDVSDLPGRLMYHTPPADQGQIVTVSYAGTYDGRVLRRIDDASDGSTRYWVADLADDDVPGLNCTPEIDGEWVPCRVVGA